jgi:Ca2+-binding RTX toxin-like protein
MRSLYAYRAAPDFGAHDGMDEIVGAAVPGSAASSGGASPFGAPPEHHDTLYVDVTTTVPAGTDWQFDDLAVRIDVLDPWEGASFYNYGSLSVTGATTVVGITTESHGDFVVDVVENYGSIQVSAPMSHGSGPAPVAYGVFAPQLLWEFFNEAGGRMVVQGYSACGIYDANWLEAIHNDGLLQVTGTASATGMMLDNQEWTVTNGGQILVQSGDGSKAIGMFFTAGDSLFENDGTLSVSATTNGESTIGIEWFVTGNSMSVVNHGTITAATAILDGGDGPGTARVYNDGTINGNFKDYFSSDTIVNLGQFNGTITFGSANDVLDNEHGHISGLVDGGAGADTAICNVDNATAAISFTVGDTSHDMTLPDGTVVVHFESFGITTGSGNDTLVMGGGNDTLQGGAGNDMLNGGAGTDTVSYSEAAGGVVVSLAVSGAQNVGGGCGTDTLISIENLTGSAFGDTLTGNDGNNAITSGAGNDVIAGGAGDDTVAMGAFLTGADRIDGGVGNDTVVINGEYSTLLTLTGAMLANVETLVAGTREGGVTFDFKLAASADLVPVGHSLFVNAALSGSLDFDGSAATGSLHLRGGGGDDILIGGRGNDILEGQQSEHQDILNASQGGNDTIICGANTNIIVMGGAFTAADTITGNHPPSDTVILDGDYSAGVVFGAHTMTAIGNLQLTGGHSYDLRINQSTVYFLTQMNVDASGLGAGDKLIFDASAAVNAGVNVLGGAGDDVLTGGTWLDVMQGAGGDDKIDVTRDLAATVGGGDGDDTILVGASLSTDWAIDGGQGIDTLRIDGDYAAGFVFAGDTMVDVEKIVLAGGHHYDFTLNDANVSAGATLTLDASGLGSGDAVRFDGRAETDGQLVLIGGRGGDSFYGGANSDVFDLSGGGDDFASGGGGGDLFRLGAALTAADRIDGGAGIDTVTLDGDYAAGLEFQAQTLVDIEVLSLAKGHSYTLATDDATVAAGQTLTVDGSALGPHDVLHFDGTAESDGAFVVKGGAGDDFIAGGAGDDVLGGNDGNDTFDLSHGGADKADGGAGDDVFDLGGALTAADVIAGGIGKDTVVLDGDYSHGLVFGAATMIDVEKLVLAGGHSYTLTMNDGNVAAGTELTVDASKLAKSDVFVFDGSAEMDGSFTVKGGRGADAITGGAGNDTLTGGKGNDVLTGGGGADVLDGGSGADRFVYHSAAESTGALFDTIEKFSVKTDKIDLWFAVNAVDKMVTGGALSLAHFDGDLASAIDAAHLGMHDAVVFAPDSGDLAGESFLIVDVNGVAGYQAGQDLVIELDHASQLSHLKVSAFI